MEIGIYYRNPFETGGCEKTILERGKILSELGHSVTFIYGVNNPQLNMLKQYAEIGNVRHQDYLDKSLDIIIYDSIYNNKQIDALKTIQVINGNTIDGNEMLPEPRADEYVTVSKECEQQFREKFSIESTIIPNPIDINKIRELSKEEYTISKKKYNFVVVSRIDQVKGFENLIKFIQKVDEKTKDYQFVIVGSNNNYPQYVEQVKQKLKNYNVIWEGLQNNPYKYMANADYLVQLSKFESQCMVMFESLIIGTPVIATDFGTAKETVSDERGFVLKQDLSNLDIDIILKQKNDFKIKYDYIDVKDKWKDIIKIPPKKDIKFSIIIPNYNNAEWLDKCLTSVSQQTYKNYEVIFIDDMSTDNSVDIAYKYIEKIKEFQIIKLTQKRYNGGARNVGIEQATGDYTMFIDSDDWFVDNNVLENLNKFIKNEDVIRLGYSLSNGKEDSLFPCYAKAKDMYQVFGEDSCACWTKVIKTSILKQVLFPEGTLAEDRVWHYRLIDKCRTFKNYPNITHIWNRANTHSTTTKKTIQWNASCYKHLGEMYEFINTTNNEQYRQYVQNKFNIHKQNLEKGVYNQL